MHSEHRCERCGKPLDGTSTVWLDLNVHTHQYSKTPWPESDSQGSFPFGRACAETVLEDLNGFNVRRKS